MTLQMNAVVEKPILDLAAPVAAALEQVIHTFDEELRGDLPFVENLVDQVRQFRGKLLRPKLLLLTAKAIGDIRREHIVLAAVVEMVHMATLVHDDVLDESDVRRRRPTINRLVGNEGAVLLGDYLISHAYHLCTSLGSVEYARRIADVTNTVCEGELMQIEHRGDATLSESQYLEIIRRKTAALTGVCCELGAAAAGADRRVVQSMAAFGIDLGIAFQIVDDLLDLTGTENELGKTVGRDADLGKWTLPAIHFRDRADAADRRRLIDALSNGSTNKSESIRSILAGSDAMDYALDTARSYVQSALGNLTNLPPTDAKQSLIAAAEFIVNRRA
jgi:octaprenyl-diphosphate synthase